MAAMADSAPTSHPVATGQPPHNAAGDAASQASQKSYRRKYLKIRHYYKGVMGESNNLIREEERMKALARRLQEQVDELQDVLLDLNEESRIPSFLRYDLGPPSPIASIVPSTEGPGDADQLKDGDKQRLIRARKQYARGDYSAEEYHAIESELVSQLPHAGPKSLVSLLSIPHTHYPSENLPEDLIGDLEELPGFLSPNHEAAHVDSLDKAISDPNIYNPADKNAKPLPIANRVVYSDKDLSLVNPVSPLNWLRKYQPQVFLQDPRPDHENVSEKSSAKTGGAKRRGRQSEPMPRETKETKETKGDNDGEEDGNFVPEFGGRGKRNKEDEPYRPKGGSGRATKRKRGEEGEAPPKKRAAKGSRQSLPS